MGMVVKADEIFDSNNALSGFSSGVLIGAAAFQDAVCKNHMTFNTTKPLTTAQCNQMVNSVAESQYQAALKAQAKKANKTVDEFRATIDETQARANVRNQLTNALMEYVDTASANNLELQAQVIDMIGTCVSKAQEYNSALTVLERQAAIANERNEVLFTSIAYIMHIYQQLIEIANCPDNRYKTYNPATQTYTPLIVNGASDTTYTIQSAEATYKQIIGGYKMNGTGQFLDANDNVIDFKNAFRALTGDLVQADNYLYYDRNQAAVRTGYDEQGQPVFFYPTIDPFADFNRMVLTQGAERGLLRDIMTCQEQEDVYNLVKQYQNLLESKYHVRWYRKNPDYAGVTDKYAGYGWELLNDIVRTIGAATKTTEAQLVLHTEYSLVNPGDWSRLFYAGNAANYGTNYDKVFTGTDPALTSHWTPIAGEAPAEVKTDHKAAYFFFNNNTHYNWQDITWIDVNHPTITLTAVLDHEHWKYYILPRNTSTGTIVACQNTSGAWVYVYGATSFYPNPDDPKTPLLEDQYQKTATSYQLEDVEVTKYEKYVTDRPYELFSLDQVELWSKKETTTFKAVITYNGKFITSNEIVFKNKSNAALADVVNDLNSRFKLQLVRPIHNAINETAPDAVFGTTHIADDNISEFYVFDERGHVIENEEGEKYSNIPYYAVLLMKDPNKEDDVYTIMQYDNSAGQETTELTSFIDKLNLWGQVTEWGTLNEPTSSTAAGYLSVSDKTKMCAYCDVTDFRDVYTTDGSFVGTAKLAAACQQLTEDNPASMYSIDWAITDQQQSTREFGNRSMFTYCNRISTERLNDAWDIGLSTNSRIFALEFKIKPDWSLASANPTETISLNINYNGQQFRVERELHFGPASTMGSEYSISITAESAKDKLTNSHVLLLDEVHADGNTGTCVYYLNAVIRHKGKELTADERAKMKVYWYLNSGTRTDEWSSGNVNQIELNSAGTLSIRYKRADGTVATPEMVVPPIVTVRVDGLANYSLFYSQPFQVFCRTGMTVTSINPWRVSVPDRVIFRSDGATPQFHDGNFEITKVEYVSQGENGLESIDDTWTEVPYYQENHTWRVPITKNNYILAYYRDDGTHYTEDSQKAWGTLGEKYLTYQSIYYAKVTAGTVALVQDNQGHDTDDWDASTNQTFTLTLATAVTGGYVKVANLIYTYQAGDYEHNIETVSRWDIEGLTTPDDCLDRTAGTYTPIYTTTGDGTIDPPWKLYSRYQHYTADAHIPSDIITDNTDDYFAERIGDVGHEYFMSLEHTTYDQRLSLSHYLQITHNGALIGDEPVDGSNAYGLPTGEVWAMKFVDGANTQWEDKLRDAHTFLACQLQDGTWFSSSIVFERSVYCSSLVNSWSGSELILDEETNTVMTQHLVVGSKDSNNTFTGLMMGDWNGKYNDGSIDIPGLYGFRSGAQTFGLLTTGEAFFGAAGMGRIYINKHAGLISNANLTAYINLNPREHDKLDNDTYDIRQRGYSPYFLYCEGDYQNNGTSLVNGERKRGKTGPNTDWGKLEEKAKDRDIFAVDPHRGVFMSGGLKCNWGNIGGWEISDAGLTKKKNNSKIYLGVGNDTGESAELNMYLYMLVQHFASDHKRGILGCHDTEIITFYQKRNGEGNNKYGTILPGITYVELLKIADKIWWDSQWQEGQGFQRDTVQRLFKAYQTEVYDTRNNAVPHTDKERYLEATKTAFETDIAAGWLLPLRWLNCFYKLDPIRTSDGFNHEDRYPLIVADESGTKYSIFHDTHKAKLEELYTKARADLASDSSAEDSHVPYIMWVGPAGSPMDYEHEGIFSVTAEGHLHSISGTIGSWNISGEKLYTSTTVTRYLTGENGQKVKDSEGDYITLQDADGMYAMELDGGKGKHYNSPFLALLDRNILLESASSGSGRTYARMGFYYDPTISYTGRMKRRVDNTELYRKPVPSIIEVLRERQITVNGVLQFNDDGTPKMETYTAYETETDANGNIVYKYVPQKYYLPDGTDTSSYLSGGVEGNVTPEYCGWVEYNPDAEDPNMQPPTGAVGYYLSVIHYWAKPAGDPTGDPVQWTTYQAIEYEGAENNDNIVSVGRIVHGGYNIVIDGNDGKNQGSIKIGQCTKNNVKYPAIELLGTGQIRLHHDNIILDGVTRRVQIGVKGNGNEDGLVSIVGFALTSRDITSVKVDYQGGPQIYDGTFSDYYVQEKLTDSDDATYYKCRKNYNKENGNFSGDTKNAYPLAADVDYAVGTQVHILTPNDETQHPTIRSTTDEYQTGTTTEDTQDALGQVVSLYDWIKLTLDTPYEKKNYAMQIEGDYLAFTRYDPTGNPQVTSKGVAIVAGDVTGKDLNGDGEINPLSSIESKTILIPANYLSSSGDSLNLSEGGIKGTLLNWDLKGDWVDTGTVYASKGVYGPAGEYASVKYVNEKLADLAKQIANLLSRLNGNIADLRRIIRAVAGGEDGIKQLLGENPQNPVTYDDGDGNQVAVTSENLLKQVANLAEKLGALEKATSAEKMGETLADTFSAKGHTHKFTPAGTLSISVSHTEGNNPTGSGTFTGTEGTTGSDSAAES